VDADGRNRQAPSAVSERIPAHQRLGQRRQAKAPDKDGWQHVLHQLLEQGRRGPGRLRNGDARS
jgi:hypothetical protein